MYRVLRAFNAVVLLKGDYFEPSDWYTGVEILYGVDWIKVSVPGMLIESSSVPATKYDILKYARGFSKLEEFL